MSCDFFPIHNKITGLGGQNLPDPITRHHDRQKPQVHGVMKPGCYVHSVSPVGAHAESCFSVGKGISSYARKTLEIHTSNMVLWPELCPHPPHSRFTDEATMTLLELEPSVRRLRLNES